MRACLQKLESQLLSYWPVSHVDSKVRLNFLNVTKSLSSLRSFTLCLLMHSGPAANKNIVDNTYLSWSYSNNILLLFVCADLPKDVVAHDEEIPLLLTHELLFELHHLVDQTHHEAHQLWSMDGKSQHCEDYYLPWRGKHKSSHASSIVRVWAFHWCTMPNPWMSCLKQLTVNNNVLRCILQYKLSVMGTHLLNLDNLVFLQRDQE